MKLLQTEINVVPGAESDQNPREEGFVGKGCTYVEITNTTTRICSYKVSLKWSNPYFRKSWFNLRAIVDEQNKPPVGQPDVHSEQDKSVKMHIKVGGSRRILLNFDLPATSESRAGLYHIEIVIQPSVSDGAQAQAVPQPIVLTAVVIVRPFYEWAIDYSPVDRRAGLFFKRSTYELVVRSRGNDWLYCDVKVNDSQNLEMTLPTTRIAVPPPEPGKQAERTVPVQVKCKERRFRGGKKPHELPLTVYRADAPSVPSLPQNWEQGGPANLGARVLYTETTSEKKAKVEPTMTYYTPGVDFVVTAVKALFKSGKTLFFLALGLIAAYTMWSFAFQYYQRKIDFFELGQIPQRDGKYTVAKNGKFSIVGTWLDNGTKLYLFFADDPNPVEYEPKKIKRNSVTNKPDTYEAWVNLADLEKSINLDGRVIKKIGARRTTWVPLVGDLLPLKTLQKEIYIGTQRISDEALADVRRTSPASLKIGDAITFGSQNGDLGEKRGVLVIGEQEVPPTEWTPKRAKFSLPISVLAEAGPITVTLRVPGKGEKVFDFSILDASAGTDSEETATTGSSGTGMETGETTASTGPAPTPPTLTAPPSPSGYEELLTAMANELEAGAQDSTSLTNAQLKLAEGTASESLGTFAKVTNRRSAQREASANHPKSGELADMDRIYQLCAEARIQEALGETDSAKTLYKTAVKERNEYVRSLGKSAPGLAFPLFAYALFMKRTGATGELSYQAALAELQKSKDEDALSEGEKHLLQLLRS